MSRPKHVVANRRRAPRLSLKLHDDLEYFGIPREKHTLAGLRSYFPSAFKIEQAHLDFDALAEVLVHLIRAGIINPC